jgi:hypothetical protein
MKPRDILTLRTFSNMVDAEVALAHLHSHGIQASLRKDDSGGMRPHFQITHGVHLVVRKEDAERAERTLKAMQV